MSFIQEVNSSNSIELAYNVSTEEPIPSITEHKKNVTTTDVAVNQVAATSLQTRHSRSILERLSDKCHAAQDPHLSFILSSYGLLYVAIAFNDVEALEEMLKAHSCSFDRHYDRNYYHTSTLMENRRAANRYRVHRIINLLWHLNGKGERLPYESLELLIKSKKIHDFPHIFYDYDLRLYQLGNDLRGGVHMYYNGTRFPYSIPQGSSQNFTFIPLSSYDGRKNFVKNYLNINPGDTEDLIAKKT